MTASARSCRAALPRNAPRAKGGAIDARGLDVTGNDAAAAAADDFAARLLRLDQGVEAILDAAKRWPETPIVQLYAAAFWFYGQTDGALERGCPPARVRRARDERARARALAWQRQSARGRGAGGDHHRVAERSLDRQDRSHVLIRQGRVREGLARLEVFLPLLATCSRPIHCHDAWHLALLHLEELDLAAAMRVFKAHIWGITPDFVVEQLDAIALLWRIEMAAGPMDAEWPAIAEHIAPRAAETFMPF